MNCNIGKQILKFRKSKCVSQTELANFLGIQSQTVSKWEREICVPDIAKLPQIAAFFGITLDELFGISGKSRQENAIFETDELISRKKWALAAKKASDFALEFPMQKKFVQKLLCSLSQALLCHDNFSKKFIENAVTLGKRAIQESNDPNIKNDIIYNLSKLLYLTKRLEEGDFYREMLPSAAMCRETLDMYRYSGEDLCDLQNQNISLYYCLIGNSFSNIAKSIEESIISAEYVKKAICNYEEACKYSKSERYLQNALLSKLHLADIYNRAGEKRNAETAIKEAEAFALEHGLYELYLKYIGAIYEN